MMDIVLNALWITLFLFAFGVTALVLLDIRRVAAREDSP